MVPPALLHTVAPSHTWLALGVEEAGWHPPQGEARLPHSRVSEGPTALLQLRGAGGGDAGVACASRERVGTLLARGTSPGHSCRTYNNLQTRCRRRLAW